MKRSIVCIIIISVFISIGCATTPGSDDVNFSYGKMMRNSFGQTGEGKVLPVAIGKAVEIDGSVTADGKYMFYSSDKERGNFDIYLRSLEGIETVRITKNPSKDIAPSISPDGRYLAYVSLREDPQGDVYVVKLDKPEKLIKNAWSLFTTDYESKSENVSQIADASGTPKSFKDADPVWSTDADMIAFSSNRGGSEENIWLMSRWGKNLRQLTKKGGIMPAFSPDNSSILFVSYRENTQGDIYSVNVATGAETRITNAPGLKLHPSYFKSADECAYTLIDKDTNSDGVIDFRDKSKIQYLNILKKTSYPLTLKSVSSFKPRFYPVYSLANDITKERISDGIVVYGEQIGDNLNISIISETGIIPRRVDINARQKDAAVQQFNTALRYENSSDPEDYPLALMRVYYYHGNRKEDASILYCSRALSLAALEYQKIGMKTESAQALEYLKNLSKNEKEYSSVLYSATKAQLEGKQPDKILESAADDFKKGSLFIPAVYEDYGRILQLRGDDAGAEKIYKKIIAEHASYIRNLQVYYSLWKIQYKKDGEIPYTYLSVLKIAGTDVRDEISFGMSEWFAREKNPDKRIALVKAHSDHLFSTKEKISNAQPIFDYVTAVSYFEKGDIEKCKELIKKVLSEVNESHGLYYSANILNARIAAKFGNSDEEALYYYNAAKNYITRWKRPDINSVVAGQISYYERRGSELESAGDFVKASVLYARYAELMKYLHKKNIFEDFYNESAPKAHVLYIDAYIASRPSVTAAIDELEDKYVNSSRIKNEVIDIARMDFDKAHLYALAYIYTLRGAEFSRQMDAGDITATDGSIITSFKQAQEQILWTNFIDDSFVDPLILQGWINEIIDIRRSDLKAKGANFRISSYNDAFPEYLLESNYDVYNKALDANDELRYPEKEGALHLNFANSQFLLRNFSSALDHYEQAAKYKKGFGSKKEEALFRFHLSYCYWQAGETKKAEAEMLRVLDIYKSMSSSASGYAEQTSRIKLYLALFTRSNGEYEKALEWYSSILTDADKYKVTVDRSRILLDCAYLSVQMNELNQAEQYLSRSRTLLEDENEKDPVNKVQIRPFNLFSIPIFDMGESLLIGETKIPFKLSTDRKKSLLLSIAESIAQKRGDIRKALAVSKRRISLSDDLKTSIDKDTYIRALNSAGFYLFSLGEYSEAKKYFEKGWNYSTDEDVHNLKGAFISIQNLANLEAHLVELTDTHGEKNLAELDSLLSRMDIYRRKYEKDSYSEKLAVLEKQYKEQKRPVTDADKAALAKSVSLEAEQIYSELDLSRAVISFYKSEIEGGMLKTQPDPFGYYKQSAALYTSYRRAAEVFIISSDKKNTSTLKRGRLLMNAAVCRMRNGMALQSYELFGEAEKSLVALRKNDVLWELYYKEAVLLRDMGSDIDRDYKRLSQQYFAKAAEQIEAYPALSASSPEKIENFYRDYALFLAENREYEKSFSVLEKGSASARVLSVYKMSPAFGDERDKKDYARYCEILAKVKEKKAEIVTMTDKGQAATPAFKALTDEISALKDQYKKHLASVKEQRSRLYFLISADTSPALARDTVVRVESFDGKTGIWKTGKDVSYKSFDANDKAGIYSYLSAFAPSYIVYNSFIADILSQKREGLRNFMFVSSADDVRLTADSLSADVSASVLATPEWAASEKNPLRYDIAKGDTSFISSLIFEKKIAPVVVFAQESETKPSRQILNAVLYSGASLVFGKDSGVIELKDLNKNPGTFAFNSSAVLVRDAAALKALQSENFSNSRKALSAGDAFRAAALSMKSGSDSNSIQSVYALNRADSSFLTEKAHALAVSGNPEGQSFYLWLLLMKGDITAANAFISTVAGKDIPELSFYRSIVQRVSVNRAVEVKVLGKSILDTYLLSLLNAAYDSAFGVQSSVTGAIPEMLSESQVSFSALIANGTLRKDSVYAEEISALKKQPLPEYAMNLFGEDSALRLPALTYTLRNETVSSAQFNAIDLRKAPKGNDLDIISFCTVYTKKATGYGLYEAALRSAQIAGDTAKSKGLKELESSALLDRAEILNTMKRYQESRTLLNGSAQLISDTDKLRYTLALAEADVFTGSYPQASVLLTALKTMNGKDAYLKDLLLAQIERIKLLENPASKNEIFSAYEKFIKSAVSHIKADSIPEKREMLFSGMDFLVSYNMAGGNTPRALYYEELKKQIVYILETQTQSGKLIEDARIADFRKKIKSDAIVMYVSRNEDDLFLWMIDKDKMTFARLKSGWKTAEKISAEYILEAADQKGVLQQMKDLSVLFASVMPVLKSKKTLYIIPDEYTAKIPFEIIGIDSPLAAKLNILYLHSIADSFGGNGFAGRGYVFVNSGADSVWAKTDKAALNRSGIKPSSDGRKVSVIHSVDPTLTSIHAALNKSGGADLVFVRSTAATLIGVKTLSNSGAEAVLYANPVIQDVNIPLFAGDVYSMLKGNDFKNAFLSTQKKMFSDTKYSHPAYWAGLRLYLNGID
jgi:tetratricopeptide (TPR) repeat protein